MTLAETMHASAVAIGEDGVLVRGSSGSGKSSLVLGLLDRDPAVARLVADDRVETRVESGRLVAAAPPALAGKLEVRGQGVFDLPYVTCAAIRLVVDLLPAEACPRMPEAVDLSVVIRGVVLPRLMLPIGAGDGPTRVRFAVRHLPPPPSSGGTSDRD